MKQGKDLANQLQKSLQTAVGTTASSSKTTTDPTPAQQQFTGGSQQGRSGADHVDAINAMFTLLEDAYPLKFKRAFQTHEDVIRAKRVWKNSLQEFSPRRILLAARKALDTSKFFPDLSDIRELCKLRYDEVGLKEPLQAYYEACYSPQQTREHNWSHIAVYLAARETGWMMLRSEEQRVAFPVFERNYEILCNRVLEGEDLEASIMKGIEDGRSQEVTRQMEDAAQKTQRRVMASQGIDPGNGQSARDRLLKVFE
ncbi:replication protein P [uncultured Endozoicomonas sp.]|uniref:replication protein P n=1 Tax=uncultured Endozoicomonas sp. TaxID=432652 RepID=UPI00261D549D|nr:replication protein P [uncultured Endozoicomonas sp.]